MLFRCYKNKIVYTIEVYNNFKLFYPYINIKKNKNHC